MKNYDKHAKSLEFDKVLERLADFTGCDDARYEATHLRPESNLELARALLNQTIDAHMLLARFGGPSFGGLKNVNNALSRANAGSVLNTRELLDIVKSNGLVFSAICGDFGYGFDDPARNPEMIEKSKRIFVEVNNFQPRCVNGTQIHISQVHAYNNSKINKRYRIL